MEKRKEMPASNLSKNSTALLEISPADTAWMLMSTCLVFIMVFKYKQFFNLNFKKIIMIILFLRYVSCKDTRLGLFLQRNNKEKKSTHHAFNNRSRSRRCLITSMKFCFQFWIVNFLLIRLIHFKKQWFLCGYSLSFSPTGSKFIGNFGKYAID